MTNKLFFSFSLLFFFVMLAFLFTPFSKAEDIKPYDTLSLSIQTGINGTIDAWDSCICLITRNGSVLSTGAYVKLTASAYSTNHTIGDGLYRGYWLAAGRQRGSYIREYYCWYGSDVIGDIPAPFAIIDTTMFFYSSGGGGSGSGCGTGLYACTLSVRDSTAHTGIRDVHIYVMNSDQTSKVVEGWTNSNGLLKFALDSLNSGTTYKIWLGSRPDYTFAFPESTSDNMNNSQKFTFYGSPFPGGIPSPDSNCIVFSSVYNPSHTGLSGVIVSARVYVPGDSLLTYHGFPISPFAVFDTTNTAGQWTLPLIPNDKLKPDSTRYIFNFNYPKTWAGYIYKQDRDTVTVPEADSINFGNLMGR